MKDSRKLNHEPNAKRAGPHRKGPDAGIIDLDLGIVGTVVSAVVGAVVVLTVLGALTSTYFGGVEDISNNITDPNVTTGNSDADNLLTAFDPVIGIVGVIGFIGLVFAAFTLVNRRGGRLR